MAFEEFSDCFVWSCDHCDQQAVFPPGDFWSALTELKARGWLIYRDRDDNEWAHQCGRCKRKYSAGILKKPIGKIVG
jgi:hypothetical protein